MGYLDYPGLQRYHRKVQEEIDELKDDLYEGSGETETELTFVTGKYINTGGTGVNIGDTIDVNNPSTFQFLKYTIANCTEGDRFHLDGIHGAASGRAWAFLTSSNVLISRADSGVAVTGYITAPANAGKVVINDNFQTIEESGKAYKVEGTQQVLILDNMVRFDKPQALTDEQKLQAKTNIGVPSDSGGLSAEAKLALLTCFEHIALWDDGHGNEYIEALRNALYGVVYPKITATYDTSYSVLIGNDVNVLKKYLDVKYYASESSTGEVVPANNYTLEGIISRNENTIIAEYNNLTYGFNVAAVNYENIRKIEYPNNTKLRSVLGMLSDNADVLRHANRRTIYLTEGIENAAQIYTTGDTTIDSDGAYLFYVPSWATKVTVTITPSTFSITASIYNWYENSRSRTLQSNTGWVTNAPATISFESGHRYLFGFSYKIDDSTSLSNLDADNIVIEFE